ncbi:hypothetical protein [Sphingomonas sp.]|uniref:hypothetical protein n=1 Tax=Sphingomonas sp. TaxID=28214 RepID=UPI0025EB8E2E|nr:hypothetical protein [Sphingomonas sp.]
MAAMAGTALATGDTARTRFRAGDAIVLGTVKNLDYRAANMPDDILGHGWITADLHITKVERGTVPTSDLKVRYFAHTYRYGDRILRFHIRPSGDGIYSVCAKRGEGVRCK